MISTVTTAVHDVRFWFSIGAVVNTADDLDSDDVGACLALSPTLVRR